MSILSPYDLIDGTRARDGGPVEIGGRVIDARPAEVDLGDAFTTVCVRFSGEHRLAAGDLAVVAGRWVDGALEADRVVDRYPPHTRPARGEADRRRRSASLAARAEVIALVRSFFAERAFVEVETPCGVPSPGLDLHLDAFDVPGLGFLGTSPELQMKRLLVGGVPRCFQLSRCFRRGEVGHRHNPEFTMLEWYRAFAGVEQVIADTEALVKQVARAFGRPVVEIEGAKIDLGPPFARLTVGEAFARFAKISADEAIALASTDEERFFRLLVEQVEPGLAAIGTGVFLTHFPAPFASLARLDPDDPRVAERFELYVGSLELCNGFGELTCPVEQRARFEHDQAERARLGKPVYPIDERFLAALEEGMPPAAGNALGLDRLVALALGAASIAEVMAFPASWL